LRGSTGTFSTNDRLVNTSSSEFTNEETLMKKTLIAAALLSAVSMHAFAADTKTTETKTPAIATSDTKNANAPVEGANSFTEGQAKDHIMAAGYTDVSGLKLDDKGVWRGTAMKGGTSMQVGLDYQGNVVTQ
jgi:opacity protein-like surface antigen